MWDEYHGTPLTEEEKKLLYDFAERVQQDEVKKLGPNWKEIWDLLYFKDLVPYKVKTIEKWCGKRYIKYLKEKHIISENYKNPETFFVYWNNFYELLKKLKPSSIPDKEVYKWTYSHH